MPQAPCAALGPPGAYHIPLRGATPGPIAGAFARTYPSLVKRLLLIAPAGLHVDKPVIARVAELPLFGEAAMHLFGKHALSAHLHDAFTRPEAPEVKKEIEVRAGDCRLPLYRPLSVGLPGCALLPQPADSLGRASLSPCVGSQAAQRFNDRLADEHPSRFASLLSTMRNFPLGGAQDMYADLGTKDVPTLVVWGKQDIVVATANRWDSPLPPPRPPRPQDMAPVRVWPQCWEGGMLGATYPTSCLTAPPPLSPAPRSKLLAELLPHASFAFYDNCGHVPMVEAREAFTHHFVAFARDGSAPQ